MKLKWTIGSALALALVAGCMTEKHEGKHKASQAQLMAQAKVSQADAEKTALTKVPNGAIKESEFVLRANGSVVSNLQSAGWFRSGGLNDIGALPGDTIYMPEELNKMSRLEISKAWTEIIYQFGLGLAGISAAIK